MRAPHSPFVSGWNSAFLLSFRQLVTPFSPLPMGLKFFAVRVNRLCFTATVKRFSENALRVSFPFFSVALRQASSVFLLFPRGTEARDQAPFGRSRGDVFFFPCKRAADPSRLKSFFPRLYNQMLREAAFSSDDVGQRFFSIGEEPFFFPPSEYAACCFPFSPHVIR